MFARFFFPPREERQISRISPAHGIQIYRYRYGLDMTAEGGAFRAVGGGDQDCDEGQSGRGCDKQSTIICMCKNITMRSIILHVNKNKMSILLLHLSLVPCEDEFLVIYLPTPMVSISGVLPTLKSFDRFCAY